MGGIYRKRDLKTAREIGIDDVIAFVTKEKLDSISERDALLLSGELLRKREKILGYANALIPSLIER